MEISVNLTTNGTREEAMEDVAHIFDVDNINGEEYGNTRIDDAEIIGRTY